MEVIKYKDKEGLEQKAVEVNSLLGDMADGEMFFGTTKEKIVDQYYNIKRQLFAVVSGEVQEDAGQQQQPKK